MIIFKKVRYKNFLSTGNQFTEIDLNKTKNTLVIGSNGAGKSTLLDALTFSLFGKSFRGINKPQLVNSINEKDCVVEIEFTISDSSYRVRRGIKPSIFEIYKNGNLIDQKSSSVDQQKWFEESILKMNYKSFTQIVIIGSSNFIPFMQLSSSNRRDVIEDLLDVKIFSSMNILLKEKIKQYKQDSMTLGYKKDHVKNKIKMQESFIEDIEERNNTYISENLDKIKCLKVEIDKITIENNKYEDEIELLSKNLETVSNSQDKLKSLEKYKIKFSEKIHNLKKENEFFTENITCPTCTQEISEHFRKEKISIGGNKITELCNALKELEEKISEENGRESKFVELTKKITYYNNSISKNNIRVSNYQDQISEIENEILKTKSDNSDKNAEKIKLKEYKDELDQVISDIAEKNEEILYHEYCVSLLKDNGIKTKIIKKYIPFINSQINKYLQMMDFYINFHLDEEFNETIKTPIHENFSYSSFSEGERTRINLSLLFAWRELAKFKNSVNCNLIVFDEVFDSSLDGFGTDEFLKIIRYVIKDANIFVISHKTGLEDKFESVTKFDKVKGFSRIVS